MEETVMRYKKKTKSFSGLAWYLFKRKISKPK